jgi:hypothetical protein
VLDKEIRELILKRSLKDRKILLVYYQKQLEVLS